MENPRLHAAQELRSPGGAAAAVPRGGCARHGGAHPVRGARPVPRASAPSTPPAGPATTTGTCAPAICRSTRSATSASRAMPASCSWARRSSTRRTCRSRCTRSASPASSRRTTAAPTRAARRLTVPYYWNIAPNRDATISPRVMTRRGVLVDSDFRYLEPTYLGEARVECCRMTASATATTRWAYFLRHNQTLPSGWSGALNLQRVSDDTYFTDLSTQIALTSQVQLPSDLTLGRGGTWGSAGSYGLRALVQRWQTLQPDPLAPVTPPYNRLPQLTLTASRQDVLNSDFDFYGQYVGLRSSDAWSTASARGLSEFQPAAADAVRLRHAQARRCNLTRYSIDPNTAGYDRPDPHAADLHAPTAAWCSSARPRSAARPSCRPSSRGSTTSISRSATRTAFPYSTAGSRTSISRPSIPRTSSPDGIASTMPTR